MKFEDALKLLREGKKVTEKTYHKGAYVFIGEQERLEISYDGVTGNMYVISFDDILADDWEEYKEPILDDVEKKYLEAVLRPFKNRVEAICKHQLISSDAEYLYFSFTHEDYMHLPNFPMSTMYKGMKVNKYYTLEELGLFEENKEKSDD